MTAINHYIYTGIILITLILCMIKNYIKTVCSYRIVKLLLFFPKLSELEK
jgi:hypothetical protein